MAVPRLRDASDQLDSLLRYVRDVADVIGLRDHSFEVRQAALPTGVRATCDCVTGRRYARITVCEQFFELEAEEQREAITHEEVHAHLHVLMEHVEQLREELGRAHHQSLSAAYRRDLERVTDALTTAFVSHIPLPSF